MKVLVVIDMQNDFIDGALGTPEAQAIVPNVKKKIEKYTKEHCDIIFTRDCHDKTYLNTNEGKNLPVEHCIIGTNGWDISSELGDTSKSVIVDKLSFGYPYWDTTLKLFNEDGKGYDIEIVGLCTDICVVSNALILKAIYPEANITVDASCCAGVTPETHKAALTTMKMCQINVFGEQL